MQCLFIHAVITSQSLFKAVTFSSWMVDHRLLVQFFSPTPWLLVLTCIVIIIINICCHVHCNSVPHVKMLTITSVYNKLTASDHGAPCQAVVLPAVFPGRMSQKGDYKPEFCNLCLFQLGQVFLHFRCMCCFVSTFLVVTSQCQTDTLISGTTDVPVSDVRHHYRPDTITSSAINCMERDISELICCVSSAT